MLEVINISLMCVVLFLLFFNYENNMFFYKYNPLNPLNLLTELDE